MSAGRRSELLELAQSDRRYAFEAYDFLCHALAFTQNRLGKAAASAPEDFDSPQRHVSGQQLLEGVREFATEQFGMMAPVVFRLWGVHNTSDFGRMVYRLIDVGLWHKSTDDRMEDFDDLYDFDEAFVRDFKLQWEEI